ncbi:MAG: response regulator [Planctomycetota bacterium]
MSAPVTNAVLVIDDDPDFRALLAALIDGLGLTAIVAADCLDAVEILQRERGRVFAILVDYTMPKLGPRECFAALRIAASPSVRLILCTAAVDPAGRASEVGATEVLAKPFEYADLERLLCQRTRSP